mmetsp:Transcript_16573/g.22885  ORF Transcript_16573/g.22885 Transcript_16573/m.22885 type:complete len:133 (+) Transcript_16573:104-502(+)|eukprot:CAMPEP_0196582418 /NCGR_PEP_ID=MMETSP1081-20130531/38863_1 /TAXON_ID=36882 /ORGANISM="Pyramimonas amylifera, Strain CCMP720" /LENGTH=132 /DNA_ID=CAMNT_0041902973 /DNA_START=104 /DNA_END=502 /DNA_ORIENTATION=-
MAPITLTIKPRVQKDKWSLYWKSSMMTKTEMLDDFTLSIEDPSLMTGAQLKSKVAEQFGWEPVDQLLRLEGFEEPWELAMYKGNEIPSDKTLSDCGIKDDCLVVTVRKVLIAEGWKMIGGGDDDSSTDEEDF